MFIFVNDKYKYMNLTSFLLQVPAADTLTAVEAGPSETSMSIWEMTVQGGWIMLLLAIASVVAIYIFVERFITINKAAKKDGEFMNSSSFFASLLMVINLSTKM